MEHPIATAIEVSVKPRYIAAQSRPAQQRYVYAYTVTIANNGDVTAQLMGQHSRAAHTPNAGFAVSQGHG